MRLLLTNLRWRAIERLDATLEWLRRFDGFNASDALVLRMTRLIERSGW